MTKISDERLAAMLERVSPPSDGWHAGLPTMDVHAALTELQQLRAHNSDSAEPVAVKPLEWKETSPIRKDGDLKSDSLVGRYEIGKVAGRIMVILRLVRRGDAEDIDIGSFDTFDAAKAAAQSDHEARIRSALASPPAKEVNTNLINEVIDFLGGVDGAVELRGRLIALTNRTPDDEVGNG